MAAPTTESLRQMYPEIEAYKTGFLKVSELHTIYYEESGNAKGKQTVVVLHGGPGGGSQPAYRRMFDPTAYRIIQFDQRGCGQSTPAYCLEENTTWDLVADIEKLRAHCAVDKWVVFGGSWGSTLALAYAETHPEFVKALILRGVFTLRRRELEFFYQEGTSWLCPDAWDQYLSPIPLCERGDLMSAYYRRLTGSDEAVKNECARTWTVWEMSTAKLVVDAENVRRGSDPHFALAFARIECHYFVHGGWFKYDGQLIAEAKKLHEAKIPVSIVQGRYDLVCPAKSAWDLKKELPDATLEFAATSGHSMSEPEITHHLINFGDKYRDV